MVARLVIILSEECETTRFTENRAFLVCIASAGTRVRALPAALGPDPPPQHVLQGYTSSPITGSCEAVVPPGSLRDR